MDKLSAFCEVRTESLYIKQVNFSIQGIKSYSSVMVGQSLDRPRGFQEVEAPRFQDSRHMKVVRLSALRTGRLYLPGNIPGTYFC